MNRIASNQSLAQLKRGIARSPRAEVATLGTGLLAAVMCVVMAAAEIRAIHQ